MVALNANLRNRHSPAAKQAHYKLQCACLVWRNPWATPQPAMVFNRYISFLEMDILCGVRNMISGSPAACRRRDSQVRTVHFRAIA